MTGNYHTKHQAYFDLDKEQEALVDSLGDQLRDAMDAVPCFKTSDEVKTFISDYAARHHISEEIMTSALNFAVNRKHGGEYYPARYIERVVVQSYGRRVLMLTTIWYLALPVGAFLQGAGWYSLLALLAAWLLPALYLLGIAALLGTNRNFYGQLAYAQGIYALIPFVGTYLAVTSRLMWRWRENPH
jgi:hypothetical protein